MKRSRFSEEQIIAILKQQESRVATSEVCREHGISRPRSTSGRRRSAGSKCRMPGS
ncbi:transposase [Paracoccus sp. (in: a-proteobacteria)]|uniref:transposase n=1 Tax=Paracoccus sp. TaxID=267 RepID=UPI0034CDE82D